MLLEKIISFTEYYKDGILDGAFLHYEGGSKIKQQFITITSKTQTNEDRYNEIIYFITEWNKGMDEIKED